jgi:cellulose synthase/poly-beta-1,6-N-acetylglucosamine synthase-like glycosyltransferase
MSMENKEHARTVDIVVPEFNELTRQQHDRFDGQIEYLGKISRAYDTYLVDDASTDGSWDRIKQVAPRDNPRLHLVRMKQNGHKVLAIKRVLEECRSEFVLLSDFDSMVVTPGNLSKALEKFADPTVAGVVLRLVPDGSSVFSKFQDIEYAIGRKVFGAYLLGQGKFRCVPGAAGLWRRSILMEVLEEHSGRHNGDDFEATAIAMRKGYKFLYDGSVVVQTMVPQTPRQFYEQRKRWALGCLETYDKERSFFRKSMTNIRNRFGHVTVFDAYTWINAMTMPLFLVNAFLNHLIFAVSIGIGFTLTSMMCVLARNEVRNKKALALIPVFPAYIYMANMPYVAAMFAFLGAKRRDQIVAPLLHRYEARAMTTIAIGPGLQPLVLKETVARAR